jgi:hypothetical protein
LKTASAHVPTIVSVYLDRPAILTNVRDKAAVLLANFGVSDAALMDVLTGRASASGRLPFELPSSMAAVSAQDPAVPDDSAKPIYAVGAGMMGASGHDRRRHACRDKLSQPHRRQARSQRALGTSRERCLEGLTVNVIYRRCS